MKPHTITLIASLLALATTASAQVKNNSVTSAKIRANAVTSAKIRANAVTSAKIANRAVTVLKLAPSVGVFRKNAETLSHGALSVDGPVGSATVKVTTTGRLGIGTASPGFPLDVASAPSFSNTASGKFFDGSTTNLTNFGGGNFGFGIRAAGGVFADSFFATSDERIKDLAGISDSKADLESLLAIEVTDYHYKDVVAHGTRPAKKAVAQQVERVYPQAVTRSTNVVPDLYRSAEVKEGWVRIETDLKAGERVRLVGKGNESAVHEIIEVRADAFRVAELPEGDEVFVYGREVDDFRSVDYEAITMLNVSATQELARRLEVKDAEITRLTKLVEALEARDRSREDRLARLETAVGGTDPRVLQAALAAP